VRPTCMLPRLLPLAASRDTNPLFCLLPPSLPPPAAARRLPSMCGPS
jgi:hypothetical protein